MGGKDREASADDFSDPRGVENGDTHPVAKDTFPVCLAGLLALATIIHSA